MLFSASGKGIRFDEKDIRIMGRTAGGVRGIRLKENDKVISLLVTDSSDDTILFATENGYGKRTKVSDFSKQGRGGQGVISIQTSDRNGSVIGAVKVDENNEIMLITNAGTLVRTSVDDISIVSRNTQGVTLIRLTKDELLVQLVAVVKEEVEEIGEESEEGVEDNEASADSAQSGEDSTDTVESEE